MQWLIVYQSHSLDAGRHGHSDMGGTAVMYLRGRHVPERSGRVDMGGTPKTQRWADTGGTSQSAAMGVVWRQIKLSPSGQPGLPPTAPFVSQGVPPDRQLGLSPYGQYGQYGEPDQPSHHALRASGRATGVTIHSNLPCTNDLRRAGDEREKSWHALSLFVVAIDRGTR